MPTQYFLALLKNCRASINIHEVWRHDMCVKILFEIVLLPLEEETVRNHMIFVSQNECVSAKRDSPKEGDCKVQHTSRDRKRRISKSVVGLLGTLCEKEVDASRYRKPARGLGNLNRCQLSSQTSTSSNGCSLGLRNSLL